jgi:putative hydrolase of HD superfamily
MKEPGHIDDAGKGAGAAAGPYDAEAAGLLALLHRVETLKHMPRSGWVDREVLGPESVAAHSWRLAVAAMLAAEVSGLDSGKAVRIALVHDLAEAVTGDSTPFDALAATAAERRALAANPPERSTWRDPERQQQKARLERAALERLVHDLPAAMADALRSAWEEYEFGTSAEAALVRQLDKMEAYIQGLEYAGSGRLAGVETLRSFQLDAEAVGRAPLVAAMLGALRGLEDGSAEPRAHTAADSGN